MNGEPPFPWMKDKPDTYRYHLENDTGSFVEYTRTKRLELGESLLKLRRIYLDTKYWVYVRDVYLDRPQKPIHKEIVTELRRLRDSASTVCPVSYSVFEELMSQSDSNTRTATAEMIDALSADCTIQPLFEVFKAELYHFFRLRYGTVASEMPNNKTAVLTREIVRHLSLGCWPREDGASRVPASRGLAGLRHLRSGGAGVTPRAHF